jgi:hypothetical protein
LKKLISISKKGINVNYKNLIQLIKENPHLKKKFTFKNRFAIN